MEDRLVLSPEIFDLSETNNMYMTLSMVICTTNTNLNGTRFTENFIDGIIENQSKFIGSALVVNREKIENEEYNSLSHEFSDGILGTDMIGSFVSFSKSENEDMSKSLIGEARVLKRFPKTCEAIKELYSTNSLSFSCEVLVKKYDNQEEDYREVNYHDGLNNFIGNAIVTNPAEVLAKPTLLVATLNEDLQNQAGLNNKFNKSNTEISSGGANMALSLAEKRKMMNEFATKLARKIMVKVRADAMMDMAELASIDDSMVDSMIGLMGEDFNANSYCSFWVGENLVFDDYFVCADYYNDRLFMMDYSINEDDVFSASNPRKAKFEVVEVAEIVLSEVHKKVVELFTSNESLKKDLEVKETELSSLQTDKTNVENELASKLEEITTLQNEKLQVDEELATVNEQIKLKDEALSTNELQANEKIIQLGQVVDGLKEQLKAVEPVVAEYNKVQAELSEKVENEKRQKLIEYVLNSKMIEEKELSENEEIKLAINELDEIKIKSIVADRIVKNNIELNNLQKEQEDKNTDIVINASNPKDLIPPSIEEKYGL